MHPFPNLTGATNFRDLGGYRSRSGRVIRRGRLLRSDHLANLAPADLALLSDHLGEAIRVVDLRGVSERETAVCAIASATVHSLPIEPTIVQKLTDLIEGGHQLSPRDVVALMQDTYRGFVRHNTHRYAELFSHLVQTDDPLVFHCTAGKDRTGFAAALILRSLDVPPEDVMSDYLLTNERLKPPAVSRHDLPPGVHEVLWGVQEDFLEAAFQAVHADYGSLDGYFREGLGLGPEERTRLAKLYLEG